MWQCQVCGFRINGGAHPGEHVCDPRSVERRAALLADGVAADMTKWLLTPAGRFAEFWARRVVPPLGG